MANINKRTGKNGEVSYKIQVLVGRDADGKQITKSTTWKPPAGMKPSAAEKEAQKQAVLFEEKVKSGVVTIDGSMKFADYAARWLEVTEMRPTTREPRIRHIERINQAIGHIPLEKLRPEHIQQFYKNMREDGVKTSYYFAVSTTLKQKMDDAGISQSKLAAVSGVSRRTVYRAMKGERILHHRAKAIADALADMGMKTKELFIYDEKTSKLSSSTIKGYHITIGAILNSAKKSRILPHSITEYMSPPKSDTPEARYLDDEQAREYLAKLLNFEDIKVRTAMILLLFTGIRRSELCGLEWQDIDFLDSKIHIRRGSHYAKGIGVYESAPKTKGSVRSITVMPFMLEVLRQYREWQDEQAAKLGDAWKNEKGRLFTNATGTPIWPQHINEWTRRVHVITGFQHINPHALRHTFITLQIAAGTDIKTIQTMSGHSNPATLLRTYTHAIQSAQDKAAAALNNMLLPPAQDVLQLPQAAQDANT